MNDYFSWDSYMKTKTIMPWSLIQGKINQFMETQQHQSVIETLRDLQALRLKIGTQFLKIGNQFLKIGTQFFIVKGSLGYKNRDPGLEIQDFKCSNSLPKLCYILICIDYTILVKLHRKPILIQAHVHKSQSTQFTSMPNRRDPRGKLHARKEVCPQTGEKACSVWIP